MSSVVFSYSDWALRYAELAAVVPQPLAQLYFNEAAIYCDNTDASPITDLPTREILLNMATAHIAQLNRKGADGNLASPLVGRINSATEGSVSVQAAMDYPPGTAQWWQQTTYGAAWWVATGRYRQGVYVPIGATSLTQQPPPYPFPYIGGFPLG